VVHRPVWTLAYLTVKTTAVNVATAATAALLSLPMFAKTLQPLSEDPHLHPALPRHMPRHTIQHKPQQQQQQQRSSQAVIAAADAVARRISRQLSALTRDATNLAQQVDFQRLLQKPLTL
jgi:hypothetical protein